MGIEPNLELVSLPSGVTTNAKAGNYPPQKKKIQHYPRCLKITEKVSFNIVSEASYVYILSGQKLIKNAENGPFLASF